MSLFISCRKEKTMAEISNFGVSDTNATTIGEETEYNSYNSDLRTVCYSSDSFSAAATFICDTARIGSLELRDDSQIFIGHESFSGLSRKPIFK
jgi:hypothetical protein